MTTLKFLEYLRSRDKSKRTIAGYARDLDAFAAWFTQTNGRPPEATSVTPLDAREYRQYLQSVKRMKPSSVNRRLAALRSYFRWAKEVGLVADNPLSGVKGMRQSSRAPRWLTRKETYALLRAATAAIQLADTKKLAPSASQGRRNAAILALLLHAGLRVSEVCALTTKDVQVEERKGLVIVRAGKGGKYREVPLNKDAREALRAWLNVHPGDTEILFPGRRGAPLRPRGVQRMVDLLAVTARLDPEQVTPHTLRHTFGKNLVDAGVPLDRVAMLMGHSNLNTTAIYTTPSQRDLANAVERVAWQD